LKLFRRLRKRIQSILLPRVYALGKRVSCPCCGWQGWKFLPAGVNNASNRLCPKCGSLERFRMLLSYLGTKTEVLSNPINLLEIAPVECLGSYLQALETVNYVSSDLNSSKAMVWSDLTKMGFADGLFDLIICIHVLEHIPDDRSAFMELKRMLSPAGFGLLMVPIRGNKTLEIPDAKPKDYEKLYGQHDHVRFYGLDIVQRMVAAGLRVEVLDMFQVFDHLSCEKYGLYGDDQYIFKFSKDEK